MKITAIVNGREMNLTVVSQYDNGIETVYECRNEEGIMVAVEERTVVAIVTPKAKVRYDYKGGEDRAVEVTINGTSEEEVNAAHQVLSKIAKEHGYGVDNCGQTEEVKKGKFQHIETICVENKDDADFVKETIYAEFKAAVK